MNGKSARILLIFVFAARGTSFLFSKLLLQDLSPMNVIAVRFLLAFLVLALVFHKKIRGCSRAALRGGLILGAEYTFLMILEMYGLRLVDSGVSSLIEHMAVVLVPLFTAFLARTLPKKKTVFCAVLAVAGVGFLSLTQSSSPGGTRGIFLLILAALTYTFCIMTTAKVSRGADPLTVGIIQLGTMGVLSLAAALFTGGFRLPQTGRQWVLVLLLAFLCSCFGFAFQPVGQKYVPADDAAILTVVNPLTASVLGIAAGESFGLLKLAGYILILTALVLYNLKKNP
nr:DMT family transporter [Lachnospiraceae bacterium]